MKRIAVEEHFATEEFLDLTAAVLSKEYPDRGVIDSEEHLDIEVPWLPSLAFPGSEGYAGTATGRLLDIGEGRVRLMQEEGIDVQVLSLISPGVQIFDPPTAVGLARRINDRLAQAVHAHPDRFIGLAALPVQDPDAATGELERAVRELGLKGASINSHTKGEYLDDKKYWPLLRKAAELNAPIYLHPRIPSPAMFRPFEGYPNLPTTHLGYGVEVSLHALRLIHSGVFDEYPGLKFMLGHFGEALSFWLWRIDNRVRKTPRGYKPKRLPGEYYRDNFYATTSGHFSLPAFLCTYLTAGADNILFAVDYPLESNADGVRFLDSLQISPADKEKISHLNAEKLFGLA